MSSSKIVFNFLHSSQRGGIETMFVAYTKLLGELGFQVVCIIPHDFCDKTLLSEFECKIEYIDIKNYFDVFSALRLRKLISYYKPAYFLSHNGRSHSLVNLWRSLFSFGQRAKVQTVGVCHGCMKRMLKFDKIICVNKSLVEQFQQLGYQGKLDDVPCFLSGNEWLSVKQPNIKKAQSSEFVFGVLGRLSEEKNVGLAIDALVELSKQHEEADFKLLVAGEGHCKEELMQRAKTQHIESKVFFCGWIKDIKHFFYDIDVLLLPSIRESFGCVILEAFQYNTPVIASNVVGPSQIIRHGENGLLFTSGEVSELKESMIKLWSSPRILSKLIENGQMDLLENYTEAAIKKKLKTILV